MQVLFEDRDLIVCIKPAGVLSTDEPGGVPSLLREQLGLRDVRTVHRLDRVVSGVMLLAKNTDSASELSRQIREGGFDKSYLAVVHGQTEARGAFTDLLWRDKAERKTYVVERPDKGVQKAKLSYETLSRSGAMSLVRIRLLTGRTHQIRCQFSAHGFPLVGDKKTAWRRTAARSPSGPTACVFSIPPAEKRCVFPLRRRSGSPGHT